MNESSPDGGAPELMKLIHDQATKIRALEKEKAQLAQQNQRTMEDMTLLNNEVTTISRDAVKQKRVAERLNQQLNDLMGMTVHDIRNALLRIIGFSHLLEDTFEDKNTDSEVCEIIHSITQSGDEALLILNGILDISNVESGNLNLKKEHLNLNELLERGVKLNKALAQNKKIDLVLAHGKEHVWVDIDPNRWQQMLSNLLSNAIKFSFPKSKIDVGVVQVDGLAALWVQDHGMGMDQKDMDAILSGGRALGRTGTSGEKSNGLGLAICKKVLDAHGGKMGVTSSPQQGTRFTLSVPVLDEALIPSSAKDPSEVSLPESKSIKTESNPRWNRVLAVDDQALNLNLLKMAFKSLAKEIVTCTNPLEALKDQNGAYDLVISDMEMPEMKGDELIRRLKAEGLTKIAVLLSAHEYSLDEIEQFKTFGIDHVLKKPLTKSQLLQIP